MSFYNYEHVSSKPSHIKYLFELLQKRRFSISHSTMPCFEEHSVFVNNHPYRHWYIVKHGDKKIGSVYLTNLNAIGLDFEVEITRNLVRDVIFFINQKHFPLPKIPSVRNDNYTINVAVDNKELIEALIHCGSRLVQQTYSLPSAMD